MKFIVLLFSVVIIFLSINFSAKELQREEVNKIDNFLHCINKERCSKLKCLSIIKGIDLDTLEKLKTYDILYEIGRCGIFYRDKLGWDSIIYNNDFLLLDTLLSNGLDINATNENGTNILFLTRKSKRMTWYLLNKGISLEQKDNNNNNIMDIVIDELFTRLVLSTLSGEFVAQDNELTKFDIDKLYTIALLLDYNLMPSDLLTDENWNKVRKKKKLEEYLIKKAFDYNYLDLVDYLAKYGLPDVNPVIIKSSN